MNREATLRHAVKLGVVLITGRRLAMVVFAASLAGCAGAAAVRCPGEPLTASQIENIRAVQRNPRVPFLDSNIAAYFGMCGKLDPVTKEQVLP